MTFDVNNLSEGEARILRRKLKAANYEESLYNFTQRAWREIDSAPFAEGGFALQAICEHLQACADGYIRNLIINVPPRFKIYHYWDYVPSLGMDAKQSYAYVGAGHAIFALVLRYGFVNSRFGKVPPTH